VAHHSVSLWQVDSIPGTLGGLYLWMCQQLFADVTHYLSLVRPMFNVLLASRHPLTSTQIYNCVTTCYPHVKVMCVSYAPVLLHYLHIIHMYHYMLLSHTHVLLHYLHIIPLYYSIVYIHLYV